MDWIFSVRRARKAAHAAYMSSLAAVLMFSSGDTYAQSNAPQESLEEVVITGSRIRRAETDTPSPVEVIDFEEMQRSGFTSTQEILSSLTANGQGTLSQGFSGAFAGGASGVSLRGLNVGATLVLIDGHRTAPYPIGDDGQRSFTDTSNLPFEAIERIEVLKDGASAVYGSAAIAGVVNVILKESYEGASFTAQRGISGENDGTQYRLSGIWGTGDLDNDGRNFYLSGEFRKQAEIKYEDRGGLFSQTDFTATGGENVTLGVPNVLVGATPLSSTGYITDDSGAFLGFMPGCDEASLNAGECGYFDRWNQIQPPTRRMNILGRFTQQFSDIWQVSFEGGFFRSESQQVRAPANTFTRGFQGLQVGPGTPPAFRDPLGATTIPSTNPSFPDAARAAGVDEGRLFYTFLDIGPRMTVSDAKQYRAVANLQGGFGEWDFESAIGYTKVDLDRTGLNSVDPRNLQAALNSTDAPYLVGQLNSAEVVAFITPPLK